MSTKRSPGYRNGKHAERNSNKQCTVQLGAKQRDEAGGEKEEYLKPKYRFLTVPQRTKRASGNVIEIDLITEAITIIAREDALFSRMISRGYVTRSAWGEIARSEGK